MEKDDVDRDPVSGRRGTSEGQKRGMWNIRLFFRGECCGARHSWPVVSVDKQAVLWCLVAVHVAM